MRFRIGMLIVFVGLLIALLIWANREGQPLPEGVRADRVVIEKSRRRLVLLLQGKPLKEYRVALGRAPVGHKEREGDGRTPEGVYFIDSRKSDSTFHRALHISYPGPADTEAARKKGLDPGGAIMIHGIRNGLGWAGSLHQSIDWTAGCIAVSNREIEEIWRAVPDGTPVEIIP